MLRVCAPAFVDQHQIINSWHSNFPSQTREALRRGCLDRIYLVGRLDDRLIGIYS
ncbi:hypothetical protein YC2023_039295 [Brassica napus]